MATPISLDDENLLQAIRAQLNTQMLAAAEPIVQEALKKAEMEMRRRLAASLIAFIDSQFSVQRNGRDLIITVRREPAESDG